MGNVVKHVALRGMRLAPVVFMRANVGRFAKVGRARILRCDQVTRLHHDPVGYPVVDVAAVIVRVRWEGSCEWIYPGA